MRNVNSVLLFPFVRLSLVREYFVYEGYSAIVRTQWLTHVMPAWGGALQTDVFRFVLSFYLFFFLLVRCWYDVLGNYTFGQEPGGACHCATITFLFLFFFFFKQLVLFTRIYAAYHDIRVRFSRWLALLIACMFWCLASHHMYHVPPSLLHQWFSR